MMEVSLRLDGGEQVTVLSNGLVWHVFQCKDQSVKGLLSQLREECSEYDMDEMYVIEIL